MKTLGLYKKSLKLVFEYFIFKKYFLYIIPGLIISTLNFGIEFYLNRVNPEGAAQPTSVEKLQEISIDVLIFLQDQFFSLLLIIFLTPLYSTVSYKLDTQLTNVNHNQNFSEKLNVMLRMLWLSFLILSLELAVSGSWYLVSIILKISSINFIVFKLISIYFMGMAFFDLSFERYHKSVKRSLNFASNHILTILLVGLFYTGLYYIPYIGKFALAPVLTTMLTTVIYLRVNKKYPVKEKKRREDFVVQEENKVD